MQTPAESDLTPLRAHYLKKSLIQLQFAHELDFITSEGPANVSTLSYLGQPFTPPPKDAPPADLPFLRYIFRQFVLTFPFMAAAPKDFYSQKLQPFVAAMVSRNLSPTSVLDGAEVEQATRKKFLAKVERNMSLFVGSATKLAEQEEVVRLTQSDLDRLQLLSKKRQARLAKSRDFFDVNIVGVRTVVDKGRMRSRAHEEFIVRTRRSRYPDVFVSRRYGDFRTLAAELTKAHPDEEIRSPPTKDRTYVTAPPMSPNASRPSMSPLSRQSTSSTFNDLTSPTFSEQSYTAPSRLAREKNRLTLRSYLHSLLASSTIASSLVLRSFLLSGPTTLTADELEDAKRREEADKTREDGRKRFAKEIASRVDGLRDAVKSVKGDVMGKDGLTHVFGTIKVTPDIRSLPPTYQAVTEWARISLASTVFHQFVASDDASESFAGLKRIHGLMPYFMLKTALKISNPISMIRTVLDLFLAQPFGGRSLLQRMFTSSLMEEVKSLEEQIEAVKDKVDDPMMCAKIRQFVYAPREIQSMFKDDAASEGMNLLTIVLRSSEEPILNRVQMQRLARAHKAHMIYLKTKSELDDSDDDDGPQDEDAWLLEDLKVLTHLYSKLKDREQLIELIFEGFTAELLKDIITIFYSPLAQVYRAASIADSLNDLQNFVNDLIKTVEQVEELSQDDPSTTVQAFIDLIQRHEQSFYHFVHNVHSKGDGLFDSLMRWVELFLTVMRDGLGQSVSLEYLLPHTGPERAEIFAEVDKVASYHYKLKVLYEDRLRRRFGRANGQSEADAEDEATQELVNGVVGEISFGDLVTGDAIDLAAEETDEEESSSEEYSSSEYETGSEDESDGTGEAQSSPGNGKQKEQVLPPTPTSLSARSTPPIKDSPHPHPHHQHLHPHHRPTASQGSRTPAQIPQPQPVVTRRRSFSLRKSKSNSNFSVSSLSLARRSQDIPPVPPVPPLPAFSKSAHAMALSKPLPSSPLTQQDHGTPPPTPSKDAPRPLQVEQQGVKPSTSSKPGVPKKKKPAQILKPPELQHIPQLLPVFVEMMRPLLRARQRTTPS
ncbi:hypothetical protein B0H34DRAFT_793725 [Crassisporium funariophilum]|nr:hypothetical protein B0H34DRAFT_793725 [Crassisporium funariophilum]